MNRHIDAKLLLFVITLITFGLVMVLSSSAIGEIQGTQFKYFYRQLIAVVLGGVPDLKIDNKLIFVVAFGPKVVGNGLHAGKFVNEIAF